MGHQRCVGSLNHRREEAAPESSKSKPLNGYKGSKQRHTTRAHRKTSDKSGHSSSLNSKVSQDSPADGESIMPIQKHEGTARGAGSGDRTGAQGNQLGFQPESGVQQAGIFEELVNKLVSRGACKLHDKPKAISSQHRQESQYSAA